MNRRGFLRALGLGSAAAVTAPARILAADQASGEDKTVFNFPCACGTAILGDVPKEEGTEFTKTCENCATSWAFKWMGDHFIARLANLKENEAMPAEDEFPFLYGRAELDQKS